MSFALHPNKVRLPPLYAMFTDDDLAPTPGTRSHAKKKPASYIPRPKNAFIIFRTLYSKWNATLPRVADPNHPDEPVAISDHRSLSKHAGEAWRCMTEDEKAPYKNLADEDKAQHRINYPDYKYSPGERAPSKKITKKGKAEQRSESPPSSVTSENVDQSIVDEIVTLYQPPRRRSSSCPPTASQSWNVALPQPLAFQQQEAGPAPIFTNPWNNSLCSPEDAFSQGPEQHSMDPAISWRRGSKDDFAVSYGQPRSHAPNPPICNSMGEFTRRVSRYETSFNSYTPSSLSTALVPPREHAWLEMPTREDPEYSSNSRWDRKKSRDDFDMHLLPTNPSIYRTRHSQDVRKASIDDFGINYGSSSRLYGWNQGFDTGVDLNPLRMAVPNEYHGHSLEEPSSATSAIGSSAASPTSNHEFSPLDSFGPLSPFVRQQIPSGYLTMHLDQNSPPPVMELDASHVAPIELIEHKLDVTSPYSTYNIPGESYYSEFVHDQDAVNGLSDASSGNALAPGYMQAMSIYQDGLAGMCPQP